MGYTAIVIAAGLSSRMDGLKPLLPIGEKPAITRLLDTIRAAGIEDVVVVTGHEREMVEEALTEQRDGSFYVQNRTQKEPSLCSVYNEDFRSGMFSSVKAGLRCVAETSDALLFPVDVPLVSAKTIRGLVSAYEEGSPSRFAVPVYKGNNGHPLLIPRLFYTEILGHKGEGGLKEVRNRHAAEMLRYEVGDEGCVLDMDTPEDYEKLLSYYGRKTDA